MQKNIFFNSFFFLDLLNAQTNRSIQIDFNQIKGQLNTFFKECMGAGLANEDLRTDWQEQLKLANIFNFKIIFYLHSLMF